MTESVDGLNSRDNVLARLEKRRLFCKGNDITDEKFTVLDAALRYILAGLPIIEFSFAKDIARIWK